ncbi:hypothetical protein KVR01_012161 [Diaporthe batatas]|uniref:uncharacterized protein n=1 Tax=Diaporthe batatas TaxID=748121 RepID=UPI001D045E9E|nr:uncharacterized protein KVR01_012161 [Diaporthe batatas]KAG8157889.1 hypothetical protein KVR01_012161 [Diaporthe batatas]
MASADGDEKPSMAPAPSTVDPIVDHVADTNVDTGDATPKDGEGNMAEPANGIVNSTESNQETTSPLPAAVPVAVPVANMASGTAPAPLSPAPAAPGDAPGSAPPSPPRIVSDIAPPSAAVPIPPRPAAFPAVDPAPAVAAPTRTASPTVNGLGARAGRTSMSNTPHQSPALPSAPIPLRASPAATQPALAPAPVNNLNHINNTHNTRTTRYQNNPTWRAESPRDYRQQPLAPAATPAPPPPAAPASSAPPLAAAPSAMSFPSPGREHIHADQKFLDDKTRISFGIHQAVPEAVRRSVRDNWEKCLVGSDFHQAFVLNASIHHATPAAVQRGIRDFGGALISAGRAQIIDTMTRADIDAVASQILSKASESFLDAALQLRLKSIDAKRLINALARAERLGYEPSDVVDEDDDHAMSLSPVDYDEQSMPVPTPQPQGANLPPIQPRPAPLPDAPSDDLMYCDMCFRKFVYRSAYEHHITKKVCTRLPAAPGGYKFSCQHCGQGFTTIMGVQYHNANNICGKFKDPWRPMPPPPPVMPPATPTATKYKPEAPASTPAAAPKLVPTPKSAPASTQAVAQSSPSGGPRLGTPGLHAPNGAVTDPYAHLSPEQLAAMQEELRQAELSYGERFRQAREIQDDTDRKTRLDGLSNSFGTKQSLIRKKYGVRLRMRRTKAEIQAERDRMQYKTAAELAADNGFPIGTPGRPGRPPASTPSRPPAIVARRSNGGTGSAWASVNRPGAPAGVPASQPPMGTAEPPLVAGGNKRRFSGSAPSETKRVAYSEMGGLSGATAAHVEMTDPTMPRATASAASAKGLGTADEPMALDDSDSDSDEESDRSAGEDIPAQLPPSVRQSLQQTSSPSVTPGPQPG